MSPSQNLRLSYTSLLIAVHTPNTNTHRRLLLAQNYCSISNSPSVLRVYAQLLIAGHIPNTDTPHAFSGC